MPAGPDPITHTWVESTVPVGISLPSLIIMPAIITAAVARVNCIFHSGDSEKPEAAVSCPMKSPVHLCFNGALWGIVNHSDILFAEATRVSALTSTETLRT